MDPPGCRASVLAFTPWRTVEAELYTHAQPPTANIRDRVLRVGEGGVSAGNARNGEGMMFAKNIVCALLSVCSQVAVGQVVAGQTLVSRDSGKFENCQRETWKSTHVNLVGGQIRRLANRIVVCELDVRELQIPVVLAFIDDHGQHLGHCIVHPLNASVAVWMMGACGKLAHSYKLVDSVCKLRAEPEAVVREYGAWAPP